MTTAPEDRPADGDRRRFLIGLGAAAGGTLASGTLAAEELAPGHHMTDAPAGAPTLWQRNGFYGAHQQGIVTPRPAAGLVAAFTVIGRSRADVEATLRLLTERMVFLTAGGEPPVLDDKLPPSDSGILGPVVAPDNLTVTASFGASFFDDRDWLRAQKPKHLVRMTKFPNDALDASVCHGDLLLQFCANTQDTNIHALRDIVKMMPDKLLLRWKQEGSVPMIPPGKDGRSESARNFLGFRDGTGNPDAADGRLMDDVVWVGAAHGEPAWATGGSYQAVRLIRNFVERWDRTPLGEQERIIGRRKMSGAPMDGHHEFDVPDYAADPEGKATRLDSHIRLANTRDADSRRHLILRRPFNYSNGVTKSGQLDQGLLFICYQADLAAGFIAVQTRLNGEPLEEYLKPVGGGYFFVPPGVTGAGDYIGRGLIEAASEGPMTPT